MPTLEYLIGQPQLQLRFLQPGLAPRYGDTQVTEIIPPGPGTTARPKAGTLTRISPQYSPAELDALVRRLSARKAAGLVVHVQNDSEIPVPESTRALAGRLGVPLLLTSAPPAAWDHANDMLQRQRMLFSERQRAHLEDLLARMPARLADPEATQRVADWLATAIKADVLVTSTQRGVLAAASLTTKTPDEKTSSKYGRVVPIVTGSADNATLTVSAQAPYDTAAAALTQYAAKVLGLIDQARHARRAVRHAAFQLLMRGETVLAQVIYTGGPKLLDTDTARVYVIDTGHPEQREPTLQWCETTLAETALVCPCPGKPRHILVLDPGHQGNRVEALLKTMVAHRRGHVMGQSRPHPLAATATSYMEALAAAAKAARTGGQDGVSLGGTEVKIAHLLPRAAAHAWARDLLAPLLGSTRKNKREQLLKTLPVAVGFRLTEAADALQIHRNTVRRRLNRAGELLGLDLRSSVSDRILVLLALDILALPAKEVEPGQGTDVPEFSELLSVQPTANAVRKWAEDRLGSLQEDSHNPVRTLCAWIENDLNSTDTAKALGLSQRTVRYHIKDACGELGIDFSPQTPDLPDTDVVTIVDIALALHVLLGRPELRQPRKATCLL